MNSVTLQFSRCGSLMGGTLLWTAVFVCATAASVEAQTVWELTPYRIQVIMATGPAPELTPRLQADLSTDLATRVDSMIGAAWGLDIKVLVPRASVSKVEEFLDGTRNVSVIDEPASLRRMLIFDMQAVTIESLEDESIESESLDKVILLAVLSDELGRCVIARELDVRTRTWNTPVKVPVWQLSKLGHATFQAVRQAFGPLAQIAVVDTETKLVTMRLRAGGFPMRDENFQTVSEGDLFRPLIRHSDRVGKLRGINAIPWTFLTVEEVLPAGFRCKVHSGFRSPLSARRRGRYEQLAVGVISPKSPTKLTLQSRIEPKQALAGYDVYAQSPGSEAAELVGRTNRQGNLMIHPGDHPLQVLLVRHGGELLARLPVVPGLESELSAEIANDDQRLEAEGFIKGLQEELVDLVTRREVLLARGRNQIKAGKLDEAGELVLELQSLKSRSDFSLYLTQEKKKVFSSDRLVQAKIDSMFKKTQSLLQDYLDPAQVEQLSRQLLDARRGDNPF